MAVFAVRACRPATSSNSNVIPMFSIFDTEDEAKTQAENWLKTGCNEVSVWQQIACPILEQTVSWS